MQNENFNKGKLIFSVIKKKLKVRKKLFED